MNDDDGETENISQNLAFLEETYNIYDRKLIFLALQTETRGSDHDTQTQKERDDRMRVKNKTNKRQREGKVTQKRKSMSRHILGFSRVESNETAVSVGAKKEADL